jgi:hypothetical protein
MRSLQNYRSTSGAAVAERILAGGDEGLVDTCMHTAQNARNDPSAKSIGVLCLHQMKNWLSLSPFSEHFRKTDDGYSSQTI